MSESQNKNDLLKSVSEIVASYVSNHSVAVDDIPEIVSMVYQSLSDLGSNAPAFLADRPQPAVPINRSITEDYLICLEDGKKLKMLKRHLKTAYGMSPDEYRERWGLPRDYPMVAPSYAQKRSRLAKDIGLGRSS